MEFMKQNKWLATAAVMAIALNGGLRVFNIWLSPTGRVLDSTIFAIWILQVGAAIVLFLGFVFRATQGQDVDERWQTIYKVAGIFILFGLISIPIGNRISRPIQQTGYLAFVQENSFLIEAISAFELENDRPPHSLEELVPANLDQPIAKLVKDQVGDEVRQQIEITAPYDSIDERSAEGVLYSYKPPTENDPWQLQVSIYLGSFQSTRFIYNPEERYSNRYRPVGRWGLAE